MVRGTARYNREVSIKIYGAVFMLLTHYEKRSEKSMDLDTRGVAE